MSLLRYRLEDAVGRDWGVLESRTPVAEWTQPNKEDIIKIVKSRDFWLSRARPMYLRLIDVYGQEVSSEGTWISRRTLLWE
jgi:hypothetical protein